MPAGQCPFCMQQVRGVGAIALLTPGQLEDTSQVPPIVGYACVDCLGLLSMMLDSLKNGNIRQLSERMIASGMLRKRA